MVPVRCAGWGATGRARVLSVCAGFGRGLERWRSRDSAVCCRHGRGQCGGWQCGGRAAAVVSRDARVLAASVCLVCGVSWLPAAFGCGSSAGEFGVSRGASANVGVSSVCAHGTLADGERPSGVCCSIPQPLPRGAGSGCGGCAVPTAAETLSRGRFSLVKLLLNLLVSPDLGRLCGCGRDAGVLCARARAGKGGPWTRRGGGGGSESPRHGGCCAAGSVCGAGWRSQRPGLGARGPRVARLRRIHPNPRAERGRRCRDGRRGGSEETPEPERGDWV